MSNLHPLFWLNKLWAHQLFDVSQTDLFSIFPMQSIFLFLSDFVMRQFIWMIDSSFQLQLLFSLMEHFRCKCLFKLEPKISSSCARNDISWKNMSLDLDFFILSFEAYYFIHQLFLADRSTHNDPKHTSQKNKLVSISNLIHSLAFLRSVFSLVRKICFWSLDFEPITSK